MNWQTLFENLFDATIYKDSDAMIEAAETIAEKARNVPANELPNQREIGEALSRIPFRS